MKLNLKNFAFTLLAVLTLVATGCVHRPLNPPGPPRPPLRLNPLAVQFIATAGISRGLRDADTNTVKYLRASQPILCAVTTQKNVTPEQIMAAFDQAGGQTRDAAEIVNVAMGLYLLSIAPDPSPPDGTNSVVDVNPYADAIFCKAMATALGTSARNAPPNWAWMRVRPNLPPQQIPPGPPVPFFDPNLPPVPR